MIQNRALVAVQGMLLLLLLGCAPKPEGLRDPGAPIGATTRFDAARMVGDWVLAASFSEHGAGAVNFATAPAPAVLTITSASLPVIAGRYREGVTGELIPLSTGQETLVVLWVDDEFRTAAIGTVSGQLGIVLIRGRSIAADKDAAVREIFDFYGWDSSQLKGTLQ